MKTTHWLLVVSLLLFISGIGFVIAGERQMRAAAAAAPTATTMAVTPVASVRQIMEGVVSPSAYAIWDSIVTDVTAAGMVEKAPRTDEEWAQIATNAAMLIESANLLVSGPRAVDQTDWPMMSRAMADSAAKALKAAQDKNKDGILAVGDELNRTCSNCHARYSRG